MKIGELATATCTQIETIRFYEREGVLPPPARTEGNYRIYAARHVEQLEFVRHCRSLDMALHDIRSLLRFKDAPDEDCGAVSELLNRHVGEVARRILQLKALELQLKQLRLQCRRAQTAKNCGILEQLTRTSSTTRPVAPKGRQVGSRTSAR